MAPLRILPLLLTLVACVTVNVYFPAEAAESAARIFTRDVYGPTAPAKEPSTPPASEPAPEPEGAKPKPSSSLLDWLITPAQAQAPDLDLDSPAIAALKSAMAARNQALQPHYRSGAIGITGDGLLTLHDPAAVPLAARNQVNGLIAEENSQRTELYREVALANGHPEWEPQIRAIWAEQWIANAPGGTWFQAGGQWRQK